MTPAPHSTNTRVLGAPEGWDQSKLQVNGLPVTESVQGGVPSVISFWRPSAEELELLNAGGLVALSVIGRTMPPVSILAWREPPPANKLKGGELARLAGIWCNDAAFQAWLKVADADAARRRICLMCGVESRSDLDHKKGAAEYFHKLIRQPFMAHQQAIQRSA